MDVFGFETTPFNARGQDDGARADALAFIEFHAPSTLDRLEILHLAREHNLCAEVLRLAQRAFAQLVTGDPAGEAEIVLDARAGSGLASNRAALDEQNLQSFGRAVDRSRKPRRTGAHDHHIVAITARLR